MVDFYYCKKCPAVCTRSSTASAGYLHLHPNSETLIRFKSTHYILQRLRSHVQSSAELRLYSWMVSIASLHSSLAALQPHPFSRFALNKRQDFVKFWRRKVGTAPSVHWWSIVDILKELFGTCDELQINKSLFGSEVGHVESLNMALGGLRAVKFYCIHFFYIARGGHSNTHPVSS